MQEAKRRLEQKEDEKRRILDSFEFVGANEDTTKYSETRYLEDSPQQLAFGSSSPGGRPWNEDTFSEADRSSPLDRTKYNLNSPGATPMREKASVNREKFLRAPIIKRKKSFKAPTVTAKDSTPLHDKNFAEEGLCDLFGSDSFKAQLLRDEP